MIEMNSSIYKFFLEKASVHDVKRFCKENGYYLVIEGNEFTLKKEKTNE